MPAAPRRVLETALYVDDLDAAELFYGGLIGLERVLRANGRHVFFRCGPGLLLLFLAEETRKPARHGPPVPAHGTNGQGHLCFAADAAELDDWRERFVAAGIAVEADFRWPNGAWSIYVRDPAGNSVEFAEPRLWGYAE